MIQRIQSLYLLIAGIFPAITLFAPVLIYGDPASDRWMTMTSLGYDATLVQEMAGRTPYGLLFFTVVLSVIPLFAIFDFKNRRRQIQRTNIALFSGLLWYVALTAYALSVSSRTGLDVTPDIALSAPLFAVCSLQLARRAIRKDEALVRAADRIR